MPRPTRRWWRDVPAIARFELAIQRREPATVLYALVFLLLTFAFISSGTVELVRDRNSLDKLSPLSITLALGGLTAFGQVITTMITASAMLRDHAWRTDQLLFTTPLDVRAFVIGRWAAAVLVMLVVYSALMVGVWLGALAPWVDRQVPWSTVFMRTLWPWLTLTVPTTIAVATILAAVAARTRRLLAVLAAALALLFLWQGCEAVWRAFAATALADGVTSPSTLLRMAAMLDPFGTTAVQVITATWSDDARNSQLVPLLGLTGASRALWLLIAAAIGVATLHVLRRDSQGASSRTPADATPSVTVPSVRDASRSDHGAAASTVTIADGRAPKTSQTFWSRPRFPLSAFTARWTWSDRGWLVIAALGALNVMAHAVVANATLTADVAGVIALVREHARLFLILLATIYGGELLWRDEDERISELVLSTPVATSRLVGARLLGLAAAQGALVAALLLGAWLAVGVVHGFVWLHTLLMAGALWLFVPFIQWTVLSLAVHAVVRHKIVGHLLLIAGWVFAVVLDVNGVDSPWLRFADPPALSVGDALPFRDAIWRATWWTAVSTMLFALTVRRWRSATSRR